MVESQDCPPLQRAISGKVREALDRLEGLVVDGLKHGFFDYSIACEVGTGGNGRVMSGSSGTAFDWGSRLRKACGDRP